MLPKELRKRLYDASRGRLGHKQYIALFEESLRYTKNKEQVEEMISELENWPKLQAKNVGEGQALDQSDAQKKQTELLEKARKLAGELYQEAISQL